MEIVEVVQHSTASLFISPAIDDWEAVARSDIYAIIDLEGGLDVGVPENPNEYLYIYYPIDDVLSLPDLEKLHVVAQLGASLIKGGHCVLSHCGMGHNRCALMAGLILTYLGMSGTEAVNLIRQKRRGALYNRVFADYLFGLSGGRVEAPLAQQSCSPASVAALQAAWQNATIAPSTTSTVPTIPVITG